MLTPIAEPNWEQLFDRYLAGEATDAERALVRARLSQYPPEAAALDAIIHRLAEASPGDVEASLAQLRLLLQRVIPSGQSRQLASRVPARVTGWHRIPTALCYTVIGAAAAFALVFATRAPLLQLFRQRHPAPITTYATRNGERADISLPDGSTVTLDVGSRLQVPADFAAGHRTLSLSGEALFTVARHVGAPFTVVAGNTAARVLGTTFLVRHYTQDTATTVSVRDGKVAVRSTVLTAHQQLSISRSGTAHLQAADPAQFTFAYGVLTLNNTPMSDAIMELDRWYDADIRLGDPSLAAHALTATFAAGSLSDLTEVLSFTMHTRVIRNGRVLTLYPR